MSVRRHPRRVRFLPTTPRGSWAAFLAATGLVATLGWTLLPGGASLGFVCWIVGGVLALLAIRRDGERAVLAYVAVLPLVNVVLFVLAELLVGHD